MEDEATDPLKHALEQVLDLFDVKLTPAEASEEEKKIERHGDYDQIVAKMGQKLDDLSEKGQKILEETGMTRDELETYATNPDNFSEEQWEALQKLRAATEDFKRRTKQIVGEESLKKAEETDKQRHRKRFGKKKHWIPL